MGWEMRKGRLYYYRKERRGGRVVSRYVGEGEEAEMAAAVQAELTREKLAEQRRARVEREEERQTDRQVEELCELASMMAAGALVLAGYHPHKGQWRRRIK